MQNFMVIFTSSISDIFRKLFLSVSRFGSYGQQKNGIKNFVISSNNPFNDEVGLFSNVNGFSLNYFWVKILCLNKAHDDVI